MAVMLALSLKPGMTCFGLADWLQLYYGWCIQQYRLALFKRYVMPQKDHAKGSGATMSVCRGLRYVLYVEGNMPRHQRRLQKPQLARTGNVSDR